MSGILLNFGLGGLVLGLLHAVRQRSRQQAKTLLRPAAPWPFYLIVYNVAKQNNLGNMLRSACAFGVAEVLVVGSRRKDLKFFGAQGTQHYVNIRTFDRLADAVGYAHDRNCRICGVEIRSDAVPVHEDRAFSGPTAFMLGNEGTGLSEAQSRVCDDYVYISQFGTGTASLNVTVAASIIFHRFAERAGYAESERESDREKYTVAERSARKGGNIVHHKTEAELKADAVRVDESCADAELGSLFAEE